MAADELGALEITFGGGEPLLYPDIAALCEWIWTNTSLGISLTTHGHSPVTLRFDPPTRWKDFLDPDSRSTAPSLITARSEGGPFAKLLEKIQALDGAIPFGVNVVVSSGHVTQLQQVADLAISLGAYDLLIIPEHHGGKIGLAEHESNEIDKFIAQYSSRCRLSATQGACAHLTAKFLETEHDDEFVFAHVSADRKLKPNSYAPDGIPIHDAGRMREYWRSCDRRRDNLMKVWQAYSSEHSARVKIIGTFATPGAASDAAALFESAIGHKRKISG